MRDSEEGERSCARWRAEGAGPGQVEQGGTEIHNAYGVADNAVSRARTGEPYDQWDGGGFFVKLDLLHIP